MDIKLLTSFLVLAESSSFREASAKLYVTQPTLTKQIHFLEKDLGLNLFSRDKQGTQLSEEGLLLYNHAKKLSEQFTHFLCVVKKIQTGKKGNLNIGYTSSFLKTIPRIIKTFSELYPSINLKTKEISSSQQEQLINEGLIDVGFMKRPVKNNISFKKIGTDHLCMIGHKNLNVGKDNIQTLLSRHPVYLLDSSNEDISNEVNSFLTSLGIRQYAAHYTSNTYSIFAMLEAEIGISLLPSGLINYLHPNLINDPLNENQHSWDIGIAWSEQTKNALTQILINTSLEIMNFSIKIPEIENL